MTQQPYAPQYPQQPYPPQAPAYPPQQYAGYPPAPPQGYAPAPPPQPLATGTIDDFYNQPSSGGGAALKFPVIGTRYVGIVTRPVGSGDVIQQTNTQGVPQFYKDGRPKFVMKVPLQMQPTAEFPDGLAQWYVKGQARDELVRAMAEAHAPEGPPEAGAVLDITFSSTRSAGVGMNDAKLFTVRYTRPQGAAPAPAAPSPVAGTEQPPPAPAQQPVPQYAPPPAPATYAPAPDQQQIPQQQYAQAPVEQAPQSAAPLPPGVPAPRPPADMSPEQQALLARLTAAQG